MCLRLKENYEAYVAEKNIICFKSLRIKHFKASEKYEAKDLYITPFRRVKIDLGNTYISDIKIIGYNYGKNLVKVSKVSQGLHSYKLKKDCISSTKLQMSGLFQCDFAIARCIIPAGSVYYVGEFGNSICYASNKIYYDKIVKVIKYKMF
jgi:hypothetical protein